MKMQISKQTANTIYVVNYINSVFLKVYSLEEKSVIDKTIFATSDIVACLHKSIVNRASLWLIIGELLF